MKQIPKKKTKAIFPNSNKKIYVIIALVFITNSYNYWGLEFLFKTLLTKKTPGLDDFTSRFFLTLKEEIVSVLHKFFQRRVKDETRHPDSFWLK